MIRARIHRRTWSWCLVVLFMLLITWGAVLEGIMRACPCANHSASLCVGLNSNMVKPKRHDCKGYSI